MRKRCANKAHCTLHFVQHTLKRGKGGKPRTWKHIKASPSSRTQGVKVSLYHIRQNYILHVQNPPTASRIAQSSILQLRIQKAQPIFYPCNNCSPSHMRRGKVGGYDMHCNENIMQRKTYAPGRERGDQRQVMRSAVRWCERRVYACEMEVGNQWS
jgi:hypothetical protein